MHKLIIFTIGICLSCSNFNFSKSCYENEIFSVVLTRRNNIIVKLEIKNKDTQFTKSYHTQLILVDGEIPEGSLQKDYNNPSEEILFYCDSAYCVNIKSINLVITLESINHTRMNLIIYESKVSDYKDGLYTLYKKQR